MTDEISEKLDTLIKLQAAALTASFSSSKDKILFLHRAGLRPTLISEIIGTSLSSVTGTLSKERKSTKVKTKKRQKEQIDGGG